MDGVCVWACTSPLAGVFLESVEEDVGRRGLDRLGLHGRHARIVKLVPLVLAVILGVGRVVTTAEGAVVVRHRIEFVHGRRGDCTATQHRRNTHLRSQRQARDDQVVVLMRIGSCGPCALSYRVREREARGRDRPEGNRRRCQASLASTCSCRRIA